MEMLTLARKEALYTAGIGPDPYDMLVKAETAERDRVTAERERLIEEDSQLEQLWHEKPKPLEEKQRIAEKKVPIVDVASRDYPAAAWLRNLNRQAEQDRQKRESTPFQQDEPSAFKQDTSPQFASRNDAVRQSSIQLERPRSAVERFSDIYTQTAEGESQPEADDEPPFPVKAVVRSGHAR